VHFTIQTYGIPESNLAELIADWEKNLPRYVKLAYLPSPERLRLRLSTISTNVAETEQFMQSEYEKLRAIIGNAIYDVGDKYLHETIGDILREKNATLATAESCTGGNISRLITSVSGSSVYFKGAVVAYSNEIKMRVLGVKSETLQSFGAVSEQTVKEMAVGVMRLYETNYAISVSGIAGPNGATDGKPVGTTWIAVADKNGVRAERFVFGTQRDTNIRRASSKALDMLRKFILNFE
jgi:nicotinamide-nucleotide amidase